MTAAWISAVIASIAASSRAASARNTTTAVTASPHFFVGVPDHAHLRDGRMLGDDVLDLTREHVEAAGDDHVLDPVDDEVETVLVLAGHVAGVQPAVLKVFAVSSGRFQ